MFMARRELTDGAFGVRLMVSADPLMGKSGYPLLFQTGETANGVDPLIDRQHPHDLLMEAALTYSHDLAPAAPPSCTPDFPGEPALGPNAFMHRLSAMENPEAPLSHHWLDSTHITWGVLTAGYIVAGVKLEASAFNGREPDENRYDIEVRALDSYAVRASYNPYRALVAAGQLRATGEPGAAGAHGERAPHHRLGELQRPGRALVAEHARLRPQLPSHPAMPVMHGSWNPQPPCRVR